MGIKVSGMYSGLDTESVIDQLASAQSYKKNKLVKAQTKLSWKQDAWKSLNSKIYSLYSGTLSNMRLQGSYLKKTTKSSNTSAIQITSGEQAPKGVNKVTVNQLAKTAYLTGSDLTTADGVKFRSGATLKQLGFSGEATITAVGANGASLDVSLSENDTLEQVAKKFAGCGLNASYDENNQRFFLSVKNPGALNNFNLVANDEKGMEALSKLGLLSANDLCSGEYTKWAGYKTDAVAYQKVIDAEVLRRAQSYKKQNDELQASIDAIKKNNETNLENLKKLDGYSDAETLDSVKALVGYDREVEKDKLDENGDVVKDENGNPVKETVTEHVDGTLETTLKDAKTALEDAKKALEEGKENDTLTEADIEVLQQKVTDAEEAVKIAQEEYDKAYARYEFYDGIKKNEDLIAQKEQKIIDNKQYFQVDADDKVTGTSALEAQVKAEFDKKVEVADKALNGDYASKATAAKVDGQDAEIIMNGAKFTSMNDSFNINGLSFKVLEETTKEVTLTTTEDTDGVYDMIKGFFTEYNKLINEMDALYNADAAKGYDPLLSEEKSELTDKEVEEWEKKIKDSLLRKDSVLGGVADAMKNALLQGATVNGKQMYLSDFGINTLGYFLASDNEKNAYHIDGDKDDNTVKGNADKLRAMIANDPDTVMQFFSNISGKLYDALTDKMGTSSMSSAFTVYNDKQMKSEYDSYKDKIKKQEDKVNALIDKWYSKFSKMETALAKMESKNNAVAGMFGN